MFKCAFGKIWQRSQKLHVRHSQLQHARKCWVLPLQNRIISPQLFPKKANKCQGWNPKYHVLWTNILNVMMIKHLCQLKLLYPEILKNVTNPWWWDVLKDVLHAIPVNRILWALNKKVWTNYGMEPIPLAILMPVSYLSFQIWYNLFLHWFFFVQPFLPHFCCPFFPFVACHLGQGWDRFGFSKSMCSRFCFGSWMSAVENVEKFRSVHKK